MKTSLIVSFALLFLSSCAQHNFEDDMSVMTRSATVRNTLSPEEAICIANNFFNEVNTETRSFEPGNNTPTTVETITYQSLTKFTAEDADCDTLLYLVNNGISPVLISADPIGPGVIAVFDNPNMSLLSTINNPTKESEGLFAVISPVINDDMLDIHNFFDTIRQHHRYDDGFGWGLLPPVTTTTVDPKVQVNWHQKSPYNMYCPNQYDAGCVAIATAQAFTVTRHINRFNGIDLNYDNLIQVRSNEDCDTYPNETDTIARFIRQIGVAVGMTYTPDGSSADPEDAVELFTRYGMMNLSRKKRDIQRTLQNYNDGIVMIASRTEEDLWGFIPRGTGHAYIVDGFIKRSNDLGYLHVNYGWGPQYNGYFLEDLLAPHFTDDAPGIYPHEWSFYCIYKN